MQEQRPIPEIQQQYQGLCTKAGHLQYQIDVLNRELKILNDTLRDLNSEALASQAATNKVAEEAAKSSEGASTNV